MAMNLAGLLKPIKGMVLVDGVDTKHVDASDLVLKVGFTFQNPDCQLFCNTVWDEVAFGPRQVGLPKDKVKARVLGALEIMRLKEFMNRHPHMLSRGQRLRVAVASVLSMKPKLLVLDEPMMGQDYFEFKSLMNHLKSLNEQGMAVIVITHDINAIVEYSTRIVAMEDGKVVADGPTREVLMRDDVFSRHSPIEIPTIVRLSQMIGIPLALSVDELLEEIRR